MNKIGVRGVQPAMMQAFFFEKSRLALNHDQLLPLPFFEARKRPGKSSNLWLYVPHFAIPRTADHDSTQYQKKNSRVQHWCMRMPHPLFIDPSESQDAATLQVFPIPNQSETTQI